MMLPNVAPISGRSDVDVAALLAGPAAPVPLVVSKEAATTTPSQEQSDAAMVVSKGVAQSEPPVAQVMAPDVGRAESDAATVASEGAA